MLLKVTDVVDAVKPGVGNRDTQDFFINAHLVSHQQDTDGPDFHMAAGKGGLLHDDQGVQRVTIGRLGARNEAVVGRVVDRGVEYPVKVN